MTTFQTFMRWLGEKVGFLLYWLADSDWMLLLFLLLTALMVVAALMISARQRDLVAKALRMKPKDLDFGPIHLFAGCGVAVLGCLHLLANMLAAAFGNGSGAYGLEGWILSSFYFDDMVPLPFGVAMPVAAVFYFYLYGIFVLAVSEIYFCIRNPILAIVWAVFRVPFMPISFLFSTLFGGVVVWMRKREEAKRKSTDEGEKTAKNGAETAGSTTQRQGEGDGGQTGGKGGLLAGVSKAGEAGLGAFDTIQRDVMETFGGRTRFGSEVPRWVYWFGHDVVEIKDESGALRVFRLMPRFKKSMQTPAYLALGALLLALLASFAMRSKPADVSLPDMPAAKAFGKALSRLSGGVSEPDLERQPEPFREVIPDDLSSALQVDGTGTSPFTCTLEEYQALREHGVVLGAIRDKKGAPAGSTGNITALDGAKVAINAALCGGMVSGWGLLSWEFVKSILHAALSDYDRVDVELAAAKGALPLFSGSPDEARAWWLVGLAFNGRHRTKDAREFFLHVVELAPKEGTPPLMPFSAAIEIVQSDLKRKRFGDAEEFMTAFLENSKARDDGSPASRALLAFVELHHALVLAKSHQKEDAADELAELGGRWVSEDYLVELSGRATELKATLGPEPANTRSAQEVYIFGILPAGVLAALMVFLMSLLMALKTPLAIRERKPEEPKKKEEQKPAVSLEEVGENQILSGLEEVGKFDVSAPALRVGQRAELHTLDVGGGVAQAPGAALEKPVQDYADATSEFATVGPGKAPVGKPTTSGVGPLSPVSIGAVKADSGKSLEAEPGKPTQPPRGVKEEDLPSLTAGGPAVGLKVPDTKRTDEDDESLDLAGPEGRDRGKKPFIEFVRVLLAERGMPMARKGMFKAFSHQARTIRAVEEAQRKAENSTVALVASRNSGRTTACLIAAMRTLVQRGESVLYVGANEERAQQAGAFFKKVRDLEGWSWNLRVEIGRRGLESALRERLPVNFLFCDAEQIHKSLLPVEQRVGLSTFVSRLGLLVIEDVDLLNPAAMAHHAHIFRRLEELLRHRGRGVVTLATALPVMADSAGFMRDLFGPLAWNLHVVPDSMDGCPEAIEHAYYVLSSPAGGESPWPAVPSDQVALAIIQAKGRQDQQPLDKTTWQTASACPVQRGMDDKVMEVYNRAGLRHYLSPGAIHHARATVFPVSAEHIAWLDATTQHAGVSFDYKWNRSLEEAFDAPTSESEAQDSKEATKDPGTTAKDSGEIVSETLVATEENPGAPLAHTTFLVQGPEPIDRVLAKSFIRDNEEADSNWAIPEWLQGVKPEWFVPRRNRRVELYHLSSTLQGTSPPGQRTSFLEEVYSSDLLGEMLAELRRKGRLTESTQPQLERRNKRLMDVAHTWAARGLVSDDDLMIGLYSPDSCRVLDRVTHKELLLVEKDRFNTLFYPGKVFYSDGVRMRVLSPRFQDSRARGDWLSEPMPVARRSARIRTVSLRLQPRPRDMESQWQRLGNGLRFAMGYAACIYKEQVVGARFFSPTHFAVEGVEQYPAESAEFATECTVFGFPREFFPAEATDDDMRKVLHAFVLLMRQTLPLMLRADPEDVDIVFGAGSLKEELGLSIESDAVFRMARGVSEQLPYIAIVDRIAGGYGAARLLHDRVLQGSMLKKWMEWCLELASDNAPLATSFWYEEESPDPGVLKDVKQLLDRLMKGKEEDLGVPLPEDEDDSDPPLVGVRARRGAGDLFALKPGERKLAEWLVPEFVDADSPWAVSFLCALKAAAVLPGIQIRAEKFVMALLLLHRRENPGALGPPVATDALLQYRPVSFELVLEEIPDIAEGGITRLEAVFGAFARGAGLIRTDGRLTVRGCALARSLLQDEGFARTLRLIIKSTRTGLMSPFELTLEDAYSQLLRAELPVSSRRILADGLFEIPVVAALGPIWLDATKGRPRQRSLDGTFAAIAGMDAVQPEDLAFKLALVSAYHAFDRALRQLVAVLRVVLSEPAALRADAVVEIPEVDLALEVLRAATGRLVAAPSYLRMIPKDVREFVSKLSASTTHSELLRDVLGQLKTLYRTGAPIMLEGGALRLKSGWEKRDPVDKSRGLLFGLDSFGNHLETTGWFPELKRLPLSNLGVRKCELDEPLPQECTELPVRPAVQPGEAAE